MNVIDTYAHHNGQIGVIARFCCETDFAARSDEFKAFTKEVCMTLAANYDDFNRETTEMVSLNITFSEYLKSINSKFKEKIDLLDLNIWLA